MSEEILGESLRSRPEAVETYCEWERTKVYRQNLPLKSVITAATEYNHYRKNDNPGAVIVKDMA